MSASDAEAIANVLPSYSVASLRQVVSVYGRLQYFGRGIDSFEGYQPYFTPWKVDDSMSVVVANLDFAGEDINVEDVWVRGITSGEATGRLGYSWYYASRGHDYSFTHRTSSSDPDTIANWLAAGLTKWAPSNENPEYPEAAIDDHPDRWLIESLRSVDDPTLDRLRDEISDAAPTDSDNKLLTARFRIPETEIDRYHDGIEQEGSAILAYPGQLEVCNRVTKAARVAGYKTKNSVEGMSRGTGADMNSGTDTELVGFATDHLKHYTSKQRERFPGFDALAAWQVQPVSEEEALYLDAAEDYIEACYSSFGRFRVYHLPYFRGTMTGAEGQALYDFLERLVDLRDGETDRRASSLTHFRDFAAERDDDTLSEVRFWTVFQHYQQKDRRNVFNEEPSISVQPAEALASEHHRLLDSDLFGETGLPRPDTDTAIIQPDITRNRIAGMVESGWYVSRTFPEYVAGTEDDQSPATDDPRPRVVAEILSGGTIDTGVLLAEYIEKLGEDFDGDGTSLQFTMAEQTAQLHALAAADMLEATDDTQTHLTEPPAMSNKDVEETESVTQAILADDDAGEDDDGQSVADRAREFVTKTPALDNSEDRAAAYLLGYTTGMMSRYQAGVEDMQRTFAARYPAHDLTVTGAKRLYTELQGKAVVYADGAGAIYQDLIAELTSASSRTPDDWNLSLVDVRFHYGQGVALALNADSNSRNSTTVSSEN